MLLIWLYKTNIVTLQIIRNVYQMKYPSESNSYKKIMMTGKSLFWKHGIRRVTVEEICKEAGVSKMTFYRQFNNKTELANKVLEDALESSLEKYNDISSQEIPYSEKIKQFVLLKHNAANDISEEFIRDIYQGEEIELKETFERSREAIIRKIVDDFAAAQEKGWIRKDLKLDFILLMMNNLTGMLMDKNLLSMYNNTHDAIMEITKFFFTEF